MPLDEGSQAREAELTAMAGSIECTDKFVEELGARLTKIVTRLFGEPPPDAAASSTPDLPVGPGMIGQLMGQLNDLGNHIYGLSEVISKLETL